MNILIYGPFSFPNGTGATARMHAYGGGLVSHGCSVCLFCIEPTEIEESIQNRNICGESNGIRYRYTCGTTIAKNSILRRKYDLAKGVWGLFFGIIQEHRQRKIDVVIYYTAKHFIHAFVGWLVCNMCDISFYSEITEFPYVYERDSFRKKLKHMINNIITCKFYDGVIVISSLLERHYRKLLRRNAKILRIPIIVDNLRFKNSKVNIDQRTICYCGNLCNLNEIENLLVIFSKTVTCHKNAILNIIGDLEKSPYKEIIFNILTRYNIHNSVKFIGPIDYCNIANEYEKADIFVLPRPSGLFSSAGFPTKLGEYLATGKPVITTMTGDIPLFLTNKIDAYLIEPDDNDAFSNIIIHVIDNPDEARVIGEGGRKTCFKYFNAISNTSLLLDHFKAVKHISSRCVE